LRIGNRPYLHHISIKPSTNSITTTSAAILIGKDDPSPEKRPTAWMQHVCDAALLSKDADTDAYTMLDVLSTDIPEMRSRVSSLEDFVRERLRILTPLRLRPSP
jgi:hypothetical protein